MWTVAIAALFGLVTADLQGRDLVVFDCNNVNTDGMVWWGCGSFGTCLRGLYTQIDCSNGTVFNRQSQQCTPAGNAPYPCGNNPPDCSPYIESPGHRRPDTNPDTFENRPPCSYYYTCSYGRFLGYQACPNGQVYDEGEQRCNIPIAVPPPCGLGPLREDGRSGGQGQGQTRNPNQQGQGQGQPRNPNTQGQGQGLGQTRNPNTQGQGQGLGQTRNPTPGQNTNSPFSGNQNTGRNPQQNQGQGSWGGQNPSYSNQGQTPGQGPARGNNQGQANVPGQNRNNDAEESWYWY